MDREDVTIEELAIGTGPAAQIGSIVSVRWTGWIDEKMFGSSGDGPPLSFEIGLGEVIAGWERAVIGMRRGGKRRVRVPPSLGYGARGAPNVPPNSTLVFEIELVAME